MKYLKNSFLLFLIALLLLIGNASTKAKALGKNKVLYSTSDFQINGKHINLIINNITSDSSSLLIDTYLLNLSDEEIKSIKNFHLTIYDANNNIIIDDLFKSLPLNTTLKSKAGIKINLISPTQKKNLKKLNFEKISYSFTYDYA